MLRKMKRNDDSFRFGFTCTGKTEYLQKPQCMPCKTVFTIYFNQILAYLSDIFTRVNDLNLSLQGKNTDIFSWNEKINAFKDNCL